MRRPLGEQARDAKAAAIRCYRSQVEPLSDAPGDEPVVRSAFLAHFARRDEVFLAAPPTDLPGAYFERLYSDDADPWGIGHGFYERRKRDLLLAVLPRPRFARGFEPGCGTGWTTVELAARCDALVASEVSPTAAEQARARVAHLDGVDVRVGAVPQDWPDGRFDLVVVSELGYYLADVAALAARARAGLTADGVLVACHWRHPAPGYPTSAEDVHAALGAGLHRLARHEEPDFLLDVWSLDPRSVARREGVLGDGRPA